MVRARLLLVLLVACDCGGCGEELEVAGPHPWVRCMAKEPEERETTLGEVGVRVEGRTLHLDGAGALRFFSVAPGADLAAAGEGVHFVLGGFARPDAPDLAALRGVGLLLPGGGDDAERMDALLEEHDHLVDLRGVHAVELGWKRFLLVSGAPEGRYALGEGSCGFDGADLEELEGTAEVLVSWAAPRVTGFGGVPVTVPSLEALVERSGVETTVAAWPRLGVGEEGALRIAPTLGMPSEGVDGERVPSGVLVMESGPEGVQWRLEPAG